MKKTLICTAVALLALNLTTASSDPAPEASTAGFLVIQDGQSVLAAPPMANGESIEAFYDYDGARSVSSNTGLEQTDTSLLFFWEGPEGLSLVMLHDDQNGGGGRAIVTFRGLPDGDWVVRDDAVPFVAPASDDWQSPGSNPPSVLDWQWGHCCTDGGAFRGAFDEPFLVTIGVRWTGIDSWQLVAGDPAAPQRIELDLDRPVVICNGCPTTIEARPAAADIDTAAPDVTLYAPDLWARLTNDMTGEPIAGQLVEFWAGGDAPVCSATTDASGVASCGGVLEQVLVALDSGYEARYAGAAPYAGSTTTAPFALVDGEPLPA